MYAYKYLHSCHMNVCQLVYKTYGSKQLLNILLYVLDRALYLQKNKNTIKMYLRVKMYCNTYHTQI